MDVMPVLRAFPNAHTSGIVPSPPCCSNRPSQSMFTSRVSTREMKMFSEGLVTLRAEESRD